MMIILMSVSMLSAETTPEDILIFSLIEHPINITMISRIASLSKSISCVSPIRRPFVSYQECYLHVNKALEFDRKGRYLLFENRNAEQQRKYFVPLIIGMFVVGSWCFKRVYNYQERYKVAVPFYLLAGIFAFSRIRVGIF